MTYPKCLIYGNIVVAAVLFIIPIQRKKAEEYDFLGLIIWYIIVYNIAISSSFV